VSIVSYITNKIKVFEAYLDDADYTHHVRYSSEYGNTPHNPCNAEFRELKGVREITYNTHLDHRGLLTEIKSEPKSEIK